MFQQWRNSGRTQRTLKNILKQIAVSFKIYADFKCNLRRVRWSDRKNNASCTEKYQAHIPCSFPYKVVCVDNQFGKSVVFYRGKNAVNKFIAGGSIIIAGSDKKAC